jgi:hypothetical protein
MIRVDAYNTSNRYAREIRTDGVTALKTAVKTLKAAWMIEGNRDNACMRVVYDAMIIGGSGGKSPACEGEGACSTGYEGW